MSGGVYIHTRGSFRKRRVCGAVFPFFVVTRRTFAAEILIFPRFLRAHTSRQSSFPFVVIDSFRRTVIYQRFVRNEKESVHQLSSENVRSSGEVGKNGQWLFGSVEKAACCADV